MTERHESETTEERDISELQPGDRIKIGDRVFIVRDQKDVPAGSIRVTTETIDNQRTTPWLVMEDQGEKNDGEIREIKALFGDRARVAVLPKEPFVENDDLPPGQVVPSYPTGRAVNE